MTSFGQLFISNLKILYRNWRSLFFNILLPVVIYIALASLKITGFGTFKMNYSDYLLPGVIAATIMQTGIFSLSYWLVDLRNRGVMKRLAVTPISNLELIISLVLTRIILMFVQIIVLAVVGEFFFGAVIRGSILNIAALTILGGAFFLCVGFLISTAARSYDEAAPFTTAINLVFTFLGNVFFPAAVLPLALQKISTIIPLSFLADGLRANFDGRKVGAAMAHDCLGLAISVAVIFAVTYYAFRISAEK